MKFLFFFVTVFSFFLFAHPAAALPLYSVEQPINTDLYFFEHPAASTNVDSFEFNAILDDDFDYFPIDTVQLNLTVSTGNYLNLFNPASGLRSTCDLAYGNALKTFYFSTPLTEADLEFNRLIISLYETISDCENDDNAIINEEYNYTFNGSNSNPLLDIYLGSDTPSFNFDPEMYFYSSTQELKITDPAYLDFIPLGDYAFSGTCHTNGTDRLYLAPVFFSDYPDDSELFNIDCIDNEWSSVRELTDTGENDFYIFDLDWLTTNDDCQFDIEDHINCDGVFFDVYDDDTDFYINILYPDCPARFCNNLIESTDWVFRFGYNLPDDSFRETESFRLYGGCDSDFDNCTDTIMNNNFVILDPDYNGYVDTAAGDVTVDSTERYFRAELVNPNTVDFIFYFRTLADTSGDEQVPTDPDGDLGLWGNIIRDLFVPRKRFILQFTNDLPDRLSERIPFGYFYEVSDRFSDIEQTGTDLDVSVPITIANTNTTIPLLDSDDEYLQGIGNVFKPIMAVFLWLGFVWLVYAKVKEMEL